MLLAASLLFLIPLALPSTHGSVDPGLERYEDMLMQNLYKRLSELDTSYFDDNDILSERRDMPEYGYLPVNELAGDEDDDGSQATEIRDSEKIEHSSNVGSQGPIHMSGGSGEATQHLKPDGSVHNIHNGHPGVKSDESLPFYCHPANPCPKGMNAKEHNCQENIEDSADAQKQLIAEMQLRGECSCDREHMFDCPLVPTASRGGKLTDADGASDIDAIVGGYLQNKIDNEQLHGEQRLSLVAKKSPRVKRAVATHKVESEKKVHHNGASHKEKNPYLSGDRLRTVAKKG